MEINVKRFLDLLKEENQRQNLISRQAGQAEMERHVQDSLEGQAWIKEGLEVVDIGSGAGFPGLVLAMTCPQARFTLIEADLKKSGFLEAVIKELGLKNVQVIRERVEKLGQDKRWREGYDLCTSRAVASVRILLEYGLPLVKPGGRLLMWKGINFRQELSEAHNALQTLGGEVEKVITYSLMSSDDRVIVAVKKVRATPDQYPRRIGVPAKKPL